MSKTNVEEKKWSFRDVLKKDEFDWGLDGAYIGVLVGIFLVFIGQRYLGGGASNASIMDVIFTTLFFLATVLSMTLRKRTQEKEDGVNSKKQSFKNTMHFLLMMILTLMLTKFMLTIAMTMGISAETGFQAIKLILYTFAALISGLYCASIFSKIRNERNNA